MKQIMTKMRDGVMSLEDQNILKARVINGKDFKQPDPLTTKFVVYFNAKRFAIDASVFCDYLKTYYKGKTNSEIPLTAVVIKATMKWNKVNGIFHLTNKKSFLKSVQKQM